jgi:hypothetical protein
MAEPKTKINDGNVETFLDEITDEQKRRDCFTILKLMKNVTKTEPKMWAKR